MTTWSGLSGAANGVQLELNGSSVGSESRKAQAQKVSAIEKEYSAKIETLSVGGLNQDKYNQIVLLSVTRKNLCFGEANR
ncbi:hypothetical protein [Pseudomonas sp. BN515]|uniref:hypothetical protein n=1 Tax=Pseudomonas sp. BN515 TaxID=2567892 RepID=UPI00245695EA|nr:hypothetical protein [Pseudomonas sp. BN515]MDH4872752.1 hypothetical protein [Pseudomonas sp. BN515]